MSKKKRRFLDVFLEGLMEWNSKKRLNYVPMERVTSYTSGDLGFGDVLLQEEDSDDLRYVHTYYE